MAIRNLKQVILIVTLAGLLISAGPEQILSAQHSQDARHMEQDFQAIVPLGIQMVDNTILLLSNGRSHMTAGELAVFDLIFDPANTGGIDKAYVEELLANMRRIHRALTGTFHVRYAPESRHCTDQQLYYTDLVSVTICPYFLIEQSQIRKARGLVHEIAHMTLIVADRPYFVGRSEAYSELTPRGDWSAQLPLIGRILREISRSDTLYHPDAYAHLASAFSGISGQLALYQRFLPKVDSAEPAANGYFVRTH